MNNNITEMVFILDRSGSMQPLTDDTIGGFNSMIEAQKNEEGQAFVTTVLFDNEYELLHDHIDINEVNPITSNDYYARGRTSLLDAIGNTINSIGVRLNNTAEDEKPSKIIVVITTDGFENSSREFTKAQVKEMIEHQQSKYSWIFMFLGANMDATNEADSLGINRNFAKTYTASKVGTQSVYSSVTKAMSNARGIDFTGDVNSASYKAVMDSLNEIE